MTVPFGNTPDAYVTDAQGLPAKGLIVPLYVDPGFNVPATGLTDPDGTPSDSSQPAAAGRVVGSTVTSRRGGVLSFGAPNGTDRLYYRQADGTPGVMGPRADVAYAPVSRAVDPTDVGYDLVLIGKQSNPDGRATDGDYANIDFSDPRIFQFGNPGGPQTTKANIITLATEPLAGWGGTKMGPALGIAKRHLLRVSENRRALLVLCAKGGTPYLGAAPLGTWGVGRTDAPPNLAHQMVTQVATAWAAAEAQFPGKNRVVAFYGIHGESDGDNGTTGPAYAAADEAFVAFLRAQLAPYTDGRLIPVISGGMVPEYLGTGTRAAIRAAQIDLPRRVPGTAYFDGTPNATIGDGNHYNAKGARAQALGMGAAYDRAVANIPGSLALAPTITAVVQAGTALTINLGLPNARVLDLVVQTSTDGGTTWTTAARPSPSLDLVTAATAPLGATVKVRAATVNDRGQSPWSVITTYLMKRPPNPVTGLAAGTPTFTTVPLSWTAPAVDSTHSAADSYLVEDQRGSASYATFAMALVAVAVTVNGLADGSTYTFRVTAQNAGGAGAPVTVTASTPSLPALINALTLTIRQAYGLRLLRSGYSGPCITVRRDNGDTLDIGFVGSALDVSTLLAFAGSGNAWALKAYDQSASGTRLFTQATTGYQPQIVASGALIAHANGTPALKFDGVDDFLGYALSASSDSLFAAGAASVFALYTPVGGGLANGVLLGESRLSTNTEYDIIRQTPSGASANQYIQNDANAAVLAITSATAIAPAAFSSSAAGPRSYVATDSGSVFRKYLDGTESPSGGAAYTRSGVVTLDMQSVGARPKTAGPSNPIPVLLSEWLFSTAVAGATDIGTARTSHQQFYGAL